LYLATSPVHLACISGVAAAAKLSGSRARVVGVEPEGAQSMLTSLAQGEACWCP